MKPYVIFIICKENIFDDGAEEMELYYPQEDCEERIEELNYLDFKEFGEKDEFEKDLDRDDFEELDEDDHYSFAYYGFEYDF